MKVLTQTLLSRPYFEEITSKLFSKLSAREQLFVGFAAESSQFIRINNAKVRQIGTVEDSLLTLTLLVESKSGIFRKGTSSFTLTGISYQDQVEIDLAFEHLRAEVPLLPEDPYAEAPKNHGSSSSEKKGSLMDIEDAPGCLLKSIEGVDIAGIYASGPVVRAMANSAGLIHWFSTELFSFDYSLYTPSKRAIKGLFGGTHWKQNEYEALLHSSSKRLAMLDQPALRIERGTYRAYLEPAAVSDLIGMFSWGTISESSIQQGDSPLRRVRTEGASFSPKFILSEDYSEGEAPRFNDEGELAPVKLELIGKGTLLNTLVSSRTAKEYHVPGNGASSDETLRAAAVTAGSLRESEILKKLDRGVYLSNLHYLNWSDQSGGRVTGMTRYACFWVENGKIIAPIENMRFDDTIFSLFGSALEDLTEHRTLIPEVGSYGMRQVGAVQVPGMLVSEMRFTI